MTNLITGYLLRKLLGYAVFALVLLALAFYTYQHERQSDRQPPFMIETLYQLSPVSANTYPFT